MDRQEERDATITISLEIENTYDDGYEVTTYAKDEVIPAPPTLDEDSVDYADWAQTEIFPFTGTGKTEGDSWYDVTVLACSDERLVGRTFEFGY